MKNTFELRNREEYLMGFVSRDGAKLVSHLLTLVLKASHLVILDKGLIVLSRDLNFFHLMDQGLNIFVS